MLLSELSMKDVINEKDGSKIGRISDLEIDIGTGRVLSVKVQPGIRLIQMFYGKDISHIPWQKIVKIGNDVIIVDHNFKESVVKDVKDEKVKVKEVNQ